LRSGERDFGRKKSDIVIWKNQYIEERGEREVKRLTLREGGQDRVKKMTHPKKKNRARGGEGKRANAVGVERGEERGPGVSGKEVKTPHSKREPTSFARAREGRERWLLEAVKDGKGGKSGWSRQRIKANKNK